MKNHVNDRGRGTVTTPANRFEATHVEDDAGAWEEIARTDPDYEKARPATIPVSDDTRSILTQNRSPDIGFETSLNPYRGCEHGCSYCYARPYHEYLGYNAGIDFETRIVAKERAPELLEWELARKSWTPRPLACSGVTDCYQPMERELRITRGCLEVLREFRHPVGIVTKNALVLRDLEILAGLASHRCAKVVLSITSLDPELAGKLEPRASRPQARLEALRTLAEAGIPCGVSVAPVIPGLNDHEIPAILTAAAEHGAETASYTVLRLPHAVKDIFADWLDRHAPGEKDKILGRLRTLRGGRLGSGAFGERLTGSGPDAERLRQWFAIAARRSGLNRRSTTLSTAAFRRRLPGQPELF